MFLVIARAFTFEVGLQFVVVRAKLLRADPSRPAGMAAIAASAERVNRYILNLGLKDRVAIAVFNGPEAHVVSGELKAVETLMATAKKDGLRGTKLNVDQGQYRDYYVCTPFKLYFRIPQSCHCLRTSRSTRLAG